MDEKKRTNSEKTVIPSENKCILEYKASQEEIRQAVAKVNECRKLENYVNVYFDDNKRKSFLVTEIMKLYLSTEKEDNKLGCLELLYKMK